VDESFRVIRVVPRGPAAEIRVGETLVAIGDTELKPGVDLDRLLGLEEVALAVRDTDGDVRTVHARPISRSALRALKYENQVAARAAFVKEKSNGRLGYHHVKMMTDSEVDRLAKALEKQWKDAEALVLDVRDGVGGMAHRPMIQLLNSDAAERLTKSPVCYMKNRDGSVIPDRFPSKSARKSWNRPVILVQNPISRSDKEILAYTCRQSGVGYLVGMPTAGGVIGGNDRPLRDGSSLTVSIQGWYTTEGRSLEGWGVPPDFRVPETHEDLYAGRDAQLEKAVEVLLSQLDGKLSPPAAGK
jgi:tricorn protease